MHRRGLDSPLLITRDKKTNLESNEKKVPELLLNRSA
jgi:hypothetical protein